MSLKQAIKNSQIVYKGSDLKIVLKTQLPNAKSDSEICHVNVPFPPTQLGLSIDIESLKIDC